MTNTAIDKNIKNKTTFTAFHSTWPTQIFTVLLLRRERGIVYTQCGGAFEIAPLQEVKPS